jgi:hypothetical protein
MEIHFNRDQLDHAIRALRAIPDGVERAAVAALNRAGPAAKAVGIGKVLGTYTVKRRSVSEKLRSIVASPTSLRSGFLSSGIRSPLTSFGYSPKTASTRGNKLSITVRRDSGGKGIKRGFVNALRNSGLPAVLQREGSGRYPIRFLKGPAVPQMLNNQGVRDAIEARSMQVLQIRFDHEISRLLRGRS